MAMAISSRQTPELRVECVERKDQTRWLFTMPSAMVSLQDALPPVVHPVDYVAVEEGTQLAALLVAFEAGEVAPDALDEFRDAALPIDKARVADEDAVGRGFGRFGFKVGGRSDLCEVHNAPRY